MTTMTTTHDHELPPHPEASFFRGEIALCRTASGSGPYVDAQNARHQRFLLAQFEEYQVAKYARYRELYSILAESAAELAHVFYACDDCRDYTYTTLDAGVRRCPVCSSGAGRSIRTPPDSDDDEEDYGKDYEKDKDEYYDEGYDEDYDADNEEEKTEDLSSTLSCKYCGTLHLAENSFSGLCTDWCLDEYLSMMVGTLQIGK